MKLSKFAYLYSKPLGNHTLKIMKKYLKNLEKSWKYHGILSVRKSGNPDHGGLVDKWVLQGYLRVMGTGLFQLLVMIL